MLMKAFRNLFCLVLLLVCQTALAHKGTILYIPMDNRPVCLDYTVETMQAAGWNVKIPPRDIIADDKKSGDSDKLFTWLEENASQSVAVVASSDALLYGGLVGSRTHNISLDVLEKRAERLVSLKNNFGNPKVYVFTTIMRSPKVSSAPVEPAYYKEWGPQLFRLGALEDKLELKQIKSKETKELADLRNNIPREILKDMYERRSNNIMATELLLHGVESGDFDYLLIGRDDTAPFSQAHREARNMDILVRELPKERIHFFAGADQLGLLLLARASNRLQYELPLVNVFYAQGKGGKTIPSYEDDTVGESAKQHIYAAGGFPAKLPQNADLVLAVNTPLNGVTLEAGNATNTNVLTLEVKSFVDDVENLLNEGKEVVVADIKYGNGSDNALVPELFNRDLHYRLAAYGGWNTAGNSLGFALAQGLLHKTSESNDGKILLDKRYLDDWAYQANVRMQTYMQVIWPKYWPNSGLEKEQKVVAEKFITEKVAEFTKPYLGDKVKEYQFTLPWNRMFEVQVSKKSLTETE